MSCSLSFHALVMSVGQKYNSSLVSWPSASSALSYRRAPPIWPKFTLEETVEYPSLVNLPYVANQRLAWCPLSAVLNWPKDPARPEEPGCVLSYYVRRRCMLNCLLRSGSPDPLASHLKSCRCPQTPGSRPPLCRPPSASGAAARTVASRRMSARSRSFASADADRGRNWERQRGHNGHRRAALSGPLQSRARRGGRNEPNVLQHVPRGKASPVVICN